MKPTANLNRNTVHVDDGKDSIVIIRDLGGTIGGRALDVSSVPSGTYVIRAGHVIVKNADGGYAPLGVSGGSYEQLPEGARYAGVLKHSVPVSDPRASILTAGQVNAAASPYPVNAEIIAALPMIQFLGAAISPAPTPPTPTESPMYFEAVEANSTVSMVSTFETAPYLEYSTDGVTWQEWEHTTTEIHTFDTIALSEVGDKVYFRGDNPSGLNTNSRYSKFVLSGRLAGGGDVMSLLSKDMSLTEVPDFGFTWLFAEAESLTSSPSVVATSIGSYGCYQMYYGCTSLVTAADMPAVKTIGAHGCDEMYAECTSLTAAADMPDVTTIGIYGCANMYYGCTSLVTAADMPAVKTIGVHGCASMYYACDFDMSDDGSTLNFEFPTPPVTDGDATYSTAYDVAAWMGNTNGFTNP